MSESGKQKCTMAFDATRTTKVCQSASENLIPTPTYTPSLSVATSAINLPSKGHVLHNLSNHQQASKREGPSVIALPQPADPVSKLSNHAEPTVETRNLTSPMINVSPRNRKGSSLSLTELTYLEGPTVNVEKSRARKFVAINGQTTHVPHTRGTRGEVIAYCTSSWYHRRALFYHLKNRYRYTPDSQSEVQLFPEMIYCRYRRQRLPDLRRYHSDGSAQVNTIRESSSEVMSYGSMLDNSVTMDNLVFDGVLRDSKQEEDDPWESNEIEEPHADYKPESMVKEIFYFDYGVVVMWGLAPEEQKEALEELHAFQSDSIALESHNELEFDIVVDSSVTQSVSDGTIFLHDMQDERMRMTISYVLSQSVKLQVYEQIFAATIDRYLHLPSEIANTGWTGLSRRQSNALTGELYMLNSAINLVSNIMDTPEMMWAENQHLTQLYKAMRRYLEMQRRLDVVGERMNVMDDMCTYIKTDINNYVEVKLYWWVIILLAVDAVLMGMESLLDLVHEH
eukprot:CFRG7080T1